MRSSQKQSPYSPSKLTQPLVSSRKILPVQNIVTLVKPNQMGSSKSQNQLPLRVTHYNQSEIEEKPNQPSRALNATISLESSQKANGRVLSQNNSQPRLQAKPFSIQSQPKEVLSIANLLQGGTQETTPVKAVRRKQPIQA